MSGRSSSSAVRSRRRPAELRALILDAAGKVFGRTGYAGATLDDIAQEAGVSSSVMYRNFRWDFTI